MRMQIGIAILFPHHHLAVASVRMMIDSSPYFLVFSGIIVTEVIHSGDQHFQHHDDYALQQTNQQSDDDHDMVFHFASSDVYFLWSDL